MIDKFNDIVSRHLSKATGAPAVDYRLIITARGVNVPVLQVNSFVKTSNFVDKFATIYNITFTTLLSYQRLLMNTVNGDMLVQLICKSGSKVAYRLRLKGIIISNRDVEMESQTMFTEESDDRAISLVQMEVMDEAFWVIRNIQAGNTWHGTSGLEVAKSVLVSTLQNNENSYGDLISLEYDEAPEVALYRDLIVPDSVSFLELFDYIQNRYGIYPKGVAAFLHGKRWWLFQPWDKERFEGKGRKLVVFNLPKERAGHLDATLHHTDNIDYIITGGNTLALDNQDREALNDGTGYRVGSIRAIDGRMASYAPGGVSEIASDKFVAQANPAAHESGIVNARVLRNHFVDNDFSIRSDLARQRGKIVQVTWNQAIEGVIYPGMPVKFMFANERDMMTRYGTVIGEVFHAARDGGAMASPHMNTVCELTLWLSTEK